MYPHVQTSILDPFAFGFKAQEPSNLYHSFRASQAHQFASFAPARLPPDAWNGNGVPEIFTGLPNQWRYVGSRKRWLVGGIVHPPIGSKKRNNIDQMHQKCWIFVGKKNLTSTCATCDMYVKAKET